MKTMNLLRKPSWIQRLFVPVGILAGCVAIILALGMVYQSLNYASQTAQLDKRADALEQHIRTLRQQHRDDPLEKQWAALQQASEQLRRDRREWSVALQDMASMLPKTSRMIQMSSEDGQSIAAFLEFADMIQINAFMEQLRGSGHFIKVDIREMNRLRQDAEGGGAADTYRVSLQLTLKPVRVQEEKGAEHAIIWE